MTKKPLDMWELQPIEVPDPDPELEAFAQRCIEAAEHFPFYVLDDKRQVRRATLDEWLAFKTLDFEQTSRVGKDTVGKTWVSTAFLGVGLGGSDDGSRVLTFETLVQGPDGAHVEDRYETWAEAEAGHREIVAGLQAKRSPQ